MFEPDRAKIQNKVRQLIRELLFIEEEARNLKLDKVAAISIYFAGDDKHFEIAKSLQDKWCDARQKLMAAAEKVLVIQPAAAESLTANNEWLTTLKSFQLTPDEINSTVTVQALKNLKQKFALANAPGATRTV